MVEVVASDALVDAPAALDPPRISHPDFHAPKYLLSSPLEPTSMFAEAPEDELGPLTVLVAGKLVFVDWLVSVFCVAEVGLPAPPQDAKPNATAMAAVKMQVTISNSPILLSSNERRA